MSVGDVEVYLWKETKWFKPPEISDHWIDPAKYPSNASHFFGSTFRSNDPIFSHKPDVLLISAGSPFLIATDGIKDVLKLDDINALPVDPTKVSPKEIIKTILQEVSRRGTQRDDISVLVRL